MGHAMVANMDESLKHRQEAKNPLAGASANGKHQIMGAKDPDVSTVKAIQYEKLADKDSKKAERAYYNLNNGQDSETRAEGYNRLQQLTREDRKPGQVPPVDLETFNKLLEEDAAKKLALESLHKALDGNSEKQTTAAEGNEVEFMQEGQRIVAESLPVKVEADKLTRLFASGSSLEANTTAAKTMEQAARSSTGILRMGLGEYFDPTRIAEWEKKGSLTHARTEINGQLRSIALSAMLGERSGDKFTPEPLDLFNNSQGVSYALEDIARRATGPQILAVAQKSMKLLSALQGYESIMAPKGKNLAPLEAGLKRISGVLSAENNVSQPPLRTVEPERSRSRQPISNEELLRRGRRPIVMEERDRER